MAKPGAVSRDRLRKSRAGASEPVGAPRYRVVHDQTYGTYEEADAERRRRAAASPDLRVRVRRLRAGYRLVVRERIVEGARP